MNVNVQYHNRDHAFRLEDITWFLNQATKDQTRVDLKMNLFCHFSEDEIKTWDLKSGPRASYGSEIGSLEGWQEIKLMAGG